MKLTYLGHACFEVETMGHRLLFDPFIRPNPLAASIDISTLKPDYILLSHGHQDHIADALEIAQKSGAPIISNWEIIDWYGRQGIQNGHPMNHGGEWRFSFGTLKYTHALHSSGLPDGTYGGNPGGFLIRNDQGTFFYSGDTALTKDFELLAEEELRFAVLPIGDNFTMGAKDAARAAEMLQVQQVVGVHYDTFPYIKINRQEATDAFLARERVLLLPAIGETIEL
jgi:L-ascorbate metabolism protein UlaG (beta-lactamase superfamily)